MMMRSASGPWTKKFIFFFVLWSVLLLNGCGDIEKFGSPEACFQAVFQKPPPSTVTDLQGDGHCFRDDEGVYLRFHISKPALMTLIGHDVHPISRKGFIANTINVGGEPPPWWTPIAGHPTLFLHSSTAMRDPSFGQGDAYLSYDPVTQIAYLSSDAGD